MTATLVDPAEGVMEGTCPSGKCRAVLALNDAGQLPEHICASQWTRPRRCPCSGWLAPDPHPRKYFYVEGVRSLCVCVSV